jgi:phage FluMu protein Com
MRIFKDPSRLMEVPSMDKPILHDRRCPCGKLLFRLGIVSQAEITCPRCGRKLFFNGQIMRVEDIGTRGKFTIRR